MRGVATPKQHLWQYLVALATSTSLFIPQPITAAYTTFPTQSQPSSITWLLVDAPVCPLHTMENIDNPFNLEINGHPISKAPDNAEDAVQAKVGSNAAIFTLKDGCLRSENWLLGRAVTENRSMLPKEVLWFKASTGEGKVQSVTAKQDGGSYQFLFAGVPLMEMDGAVFADMLQGMFFVLVCRDVLLTGHRGGFHCYGENAHLNEVLEENAWVVGWRRCWGPKVLER
jgi:hypothetical protein